MREWTDAYRQELQARFDGITERAADRWRPTRGLQAPAIEDIAIGQAKRVRGAVLFFDICGFSRFSGSADEADMVRTLLLLNTVIPLMMSVVYDHEGYVEKNTGDGLMAIIGVGKTDGEAARATMATAATMMYAMREMVNPQLILLGIPTIQVRITADLGDLLLARIGVPAGSAAQTRSYLTAIGPAANLASKLAEDVAQPNEILVGDLVWRNSGEVMSFSAATPANWEWRYAGSTLPYWAWRYTTQRSSGLFRALASLLAANQAQPPALARRSLLAPPPAR